MKKLFFGILFVATFAACSKSELKTLGDEQPPVPTETITLTEEEGKRMVLLETDYRVSSEELLRQAGFLVEQIEKREAETKGTITAKRIPMLTDSLVGMQTKSAEGFGEGDGKVYIVSLGEGLGFGLFAGDKRGGGLIGYSEEGDFDPDAAPAEAQFLFQALTDYVSNTIEQTEAMRGDSIYEQLVAKFGFVGEQQIGTKAAPYPIYIDAPPHDQTLRVDLGRTYEGTTTIGPLLTTKWGQREPYNNLIKQFVGNYPVGCVATAVAQIMNYHKHGSWSNRPYYWSQFRSVHYSYETDAVTNNLSDLFYCIGLPANLAIDYDSDGSSAKDNRVPPTLTNYGYVYDGLTDYNSYSVQSSLINRRPVYMAGTNGRWFLDINQWRDGHAWVIDGSETKQVYDNFRIDYYYQGQLVESKTYKNSVSTNATLHHNWGWGGAYDCWLAAGLFTPYPHDPGFDFEYNKKIIANIRPK